MCHNIVLYKCSHTRKERDSWCLCNRNPWVSFIDVDGDCNDCSKDQERYNRDLREAESESLADALLGMNFMDEDLASRLDSEFDGSVNESTGELGVDDGSAAEGDNEQRDDNDSGPNNRSDVRLHDEASTDNSGHMLTGDADRSERDLSEQSQIGNKAAEEDAQRKAAVEAETCKGGDSAEGQG